MKLKIILVGLNIGGNVPMGLAYLKAYVLSLSHLAGEIEIVIQDYDILTMPEYIAEHVLREKPYIVGFNVMHGSLRTVTKAGRYIKQISPDIKIVLGGVEITPIAEDVMKTSPFVDIIVCGEGEQTFAEILEVVLKDGCCFEIPGTVVRHQGEVRVNPERQLLDMNSIPSPYLTGVIDCSKYHALHIETFRGCPYSCDYCNEGRGFKEIRSFSRERIFEELEFILKAGYKNVKFYDTTFNFDRERARNILEFIARNNCQETRVRFGAEVRMELFDPEMVELALKANMIDIETGMQSIREKTLKGIGRVNNMNKFRENVEYSVKRGIRVLIHIMGGLPGDTLSDVYEAYDYVTSLGATPCIFHTKVLPGTALFKQASKENYVFDPDPPYDMINNTSFNLQQFQRYNTFGLAQILLSPYNSLIRCLYNNINMRPSEVIERFAKLLESVGEWQRIVLRYKWWDATIDSSFMAYVIRNRHIWDGVLAGLIDEIRDSLTAHEKMVIDDFKNYLYAFEEVRRMQPPRSLSTQHISEDMSCILSQSQRFVTFRFDIRPLIENAESSLSDIKEEMANLLITRNANGTFTKVINPQMKFLLESFVTPTRFKDAIRNLTGCEFTILSEENKNLFRNMFRDMVKDEILQVMESI
ncbi:MAG: B12-binding domain-containing radical SAM protein [Candidatus Loosdrechtia sp.]|uniref:B12-binding domain-containing radical SAM protein n=1 Tax=Candidatus Loosdrechtia sp. TaxID=3101272 RepID=UPI003A783427|nr:MAG: radical SAM protein [Candidatus Jettenia sp. AMX2]